MSKQESPFSTNSQLSLSLISFLPDCRLSYHGLRHESRDRLYVACVQQKREIMTPHVVTSHLSI